MTAFTELPDCLLASVVQTVREQIAAEKARWAQAIRDGLTEECSDCSEGLVAAGWTRGSWEQPPEPTGFVECETCCGRGRVLATCDGCGDPDNQVCELDADKKPVCAVCARERAADALEAA